MFNLPVLKNNKYIAMSASKITYFLSDVKIKSIFKFKNDSGYLVEFYIPISVNSDITGELIALDNKIFDNILNESLKWFDKSINYDELKLMYNPSFCQQNLTMSVILSNNILTKGTYNNTNLNDTKDILAILNDKILLKKCLIDITIIHNGLHFYKEQASNKWLIKSINIIDTSIDTYQWIDEDMIDKLKDNMINVSKKTKKKILEYQEKIELLEKNLKYATELLESDKMNNKIGEEELNEIQKIITIQKDLLM